MSQPELLTVFPEEGYKLLLSYENGEKKIFDVSPYISGAWYGELKDLETFKKVRVSNHSVEWEGGQDIRSEERRVGKAPHELYYNSISV